MAIEKDKYSKSLMAEKVKTRQVAFLKRDGK